MMRIEKTIGKKVDILQHVGYEIEAGREAVLKQYQLLLSGLMKGVLFIYLFF